MLMMKRVNGVKCIDYRKTSFLIESYKLGQSNVSRSEFARFQEAVKQHNDRAIFEVLNEWCVSVEYYF